MEEPTPEIIDASTKELGRSAKSAKGMEEGAPAVDAESAKGMEEGAPAADAANKKNFERKNTVSSTPPMFSPAAERGPAEAAFYSLGRGLGAKPIVALVVVAALFAGLTSGMFTSASSDRDLFGSLILRPDTRLNRESKDTDHKLDKGFESGSEATNARSTSGSSNVLTQKHMVEMARFYREKNVLNINNEDRGVEYKPRDILALTGPQPLRFTCLDCFQEGAYDYFLPSLTLLSERLEPLVKLNDEMLAPFGARAPFGAQSYTPYDVCLYTRVAVAYTPSTSVDPSQFGPCRQFVDADQAAVDHIALGEAYDFHRLYAVDYVKSAPSLKFTWGCRRPFADEPPGRCPGATCCQVSQIWAACALCDIAGDEVCSSLGDFSQAICESKYAPMMKNDDDWAVNPKFDPAFAQEPACPAFDYYPVSTEFANVISSAPAYPTSTDVTGCRASKAAVVDTAPYVESLMQDILCDYAGSGEKTCPALSGRDYAWELLGANLATDDEVFETAAQINEPCYMWDGGSALPAVSKELTLGQIKNKGTKALQVVYVSMGYDAVKGVLAAQGVDVSSHKAKQGRIAWLKKWGKKLKGRYDGGDLLFGTYTSTDVTETLKEATIPEMWLIYVGYALILGYALTVFAMRTPGGAAHKARALLLAVGGIACVFFGASSGVGLGCYAGLEFNALSVQVLPFLLLGLGINDLFVFFYRYIDVIKSDALDRAAADYASRVVAGVVSTAGYTVTITSISNIIAFAIADTVEMRIVAQFASLAACGLAGTYVGVFFGFSALLAFHAPSFKQSAVDDEREEPMRRRSQRNIQFGKPQNLISKSTDGSRVEDLDDDDEPPRGGCDAVLRNYAYTLTTRPVKYVALILGLALVVALAIPGIPMLDMGMPLYSIFKEGSSPKTFWKTKDEHLPTQFFYVTTEEADWPLKHPLLASVADPSRYSLEERVAGSKNMINPPPSPSWYSVFIQWLLPCNWDSFEDPAAKAWTAAETQAACASNMWYSNFGGAAVFNPRCMIGDPNSEGIEGSCGPRVTAWSKGDPYLSPQEFPTGMGKQAMFASGQSGLRSGSVPACTVWPVQLLMCGEKNPDGTDKSCFADAFPADLWADITDGDPTADPPKPATTNVFGVHPNHFYECLNLFLNSDSLHTLTSPGWNCEDPSDRTKRIACGAIPPDAATHARRIWRGKDGDGDMDFTRARVWAKGLKTGADWVDTIDSVRKRMNNFVSDTKAYAYPTGRLWKFYSQYRWLPKKIASGLGYSLLAMFGIMWLFFSAGQPASRGSVPLRVGRAAWNAALVCCFIAVTVLLFIALMGLSDLLLNCFTAVTVIMAVGIAVEFLAHTGYEHLRCEGTREEAAYHATWTYLGPIVDGAITSFLGFIPLAFARYEYIQLYYFQLYSIVLACGLLVGVVVFPAALATVGQQ